MKRLLLAFVLLCPYTPLPAAEPAAPGAVEAELMRLLDEFLAGASRNDVGTHERFWADDLVYTGSAGTRVGKAEILEGIRSGPSGEDAPPTVYSAEDVRVRLYGDTAVVAFRLVAKTGEGAAAEVAHYLNTGTLIRRDGEWRAVAWQATAVPE